jgi:predicted Zn-dependent protease
MPARPAMIDENGARELIQRVLSWSRADEASVHIADGTSAHLRFARNSPSTSGAVTGPTITISSSLGRRTGAVTVNQLDDAALREAVSRSEGIARLAPEDPEHMPALPAQDYLAVEAWHEPTAREGSAKMAAGAAQAIDAARQQDLVAAGFTRTDARAEALGNSAGLLAHHRSTGAAFSTTVRTPDGTGSGWAGRAARRIDQLDYGGAAAMAVDKAVRSRAPRALAPGEYPTILEPACVAGLLNLMASSMDTRRADEGRSFFAGPRGGTRLGEQLLPAAVDVRSDPADPRCAARPWSGDGLPHRARAWIDRGRVTTLACDRFWAQDKKLEPVARPPNLIMAGGQGTLADLIRATRRAVLVTSLWYIRSVDPQTLLYTGLTRDGVFWVENGEIAYPVNNFRWNDSPVAVFKKIEAMTASEVRPGRGDAAPTTVVPAMRVSGFTFSSVSDAV